MAKSIYRKMTGRARALDGFSQLWIAPDHLLLVRSTRFRENYRRFALADIQAIVVTELPSRIPLQFVLVAAAIGWIFLAMFFDSWFGRGFFLFTGVLGLALAIVDIARGPRCRCFLHTAVSRELLAPVNRMSIAHDFNLKIQPAIEAVQGSIAVERLPEVEERISFSMPSDTAPPELVNKPGYLPEAVFGVFLLNAIIILIGALLQKSQATSALLSTLPGELLVVVVALIRRGSRDPRRYIYVLMLVSLAGIVWDFVEFFRNFAGWFMQAVDAGQHGRPAPIEMFNGPMLFPRTHAFFAAAWRIAAGVIGLTLAFTERKQSAPAKPIPVEMAETQ